MRIPIDFERELGLRAIKVDNKFTDTVLPAKFKSL